jgi:putative N6-adenine-specific DNA methylase
MVKYNENDLAESPQLVIVRLVHDLCTISIDSSGANLHRRGYRLATAKAPLRETLAAGLVMASGWDGASPLIDPFCGSGTIPIEAALTANKISPGMNRRFAFMDWPDFDSSLWGSILSESQTHVRDCELHISGSDRDAGAIKISQSNAMRAGVSNCIEFSHRAVSAIEPVGIGWVVTNPPYGVRTRSNKDLRDLYAQFGNTLRLKCPGWHIAVLCADFQLLGNIGLKLDTGLTLVNGGIPVRVARGTVEW